MIESKSKLSVTVAGIDLKNPLILGSSDLTVHEDGMRTFMDAGFGAIVTKTCTENAILGNPKPWVTFEKDRYLLVSGGLPNPGFKVMAERIQSIKEEALKKDCKIFASLAGTSPDQHAEIAQTLEKAGADAIQINMFCPHRGPLVGNEEPVGRYWANDPKRAASVVRAVKPALKIPLFIKFRGEHIMTDPSLGIAIQEAGADGVAVVPHPDGMLVNIHEAKGILGNIEKCGSVCGTTLKPIGIKTTADMVRAISSPVVAGAGVVRGTDAIEYLMVGASAVELCTAMYWYGPKSLEVFLKDIEEFLIGSAYGTVRKLQGVALKNLTDMPRVYRDAGFTERFEGKRD